MKRMSVVIAMALALAACGGTADSDGGATSDGSSSELPDPCALASDTVLDSYFTQPVEPEPGETGPLDTCRWVDDNSNSLLIQVRSGTEVYRIESCGDDCMDLSFADDGFAWTSPLQSGADFVTGGTWYSVTTTGMGDDLDSIAALAEQVYEVATG